MATELEELIRYWQGYLATQVTVFYSPEREKIEATIARLEELKKLTEEK